MTINSGQCTSNVIVLEVIEEVESVVKAGINSPLIQHLTFIYFYQIILSLVAIIYYYCCDLLIINIKRNCEFT